MPAENAAILLAAPGLETSVSRHMRSTAASPHYTVEVGQWTGPAARHAKAITAYYEVSPGMYFRAEIDTRRFVSGVGAFKKVSRFQYPASHTECSGANQVSPLFL